MRSALTTLGVIIGIAAIVSLLSMSQGLQSTVAYQLQAGLATDTLIVPHSASSPALQQNDSRAIEGIDQCPWPCHCCKVRRCSAGGSTMEVTW